MAPPSLQLPLVVLATAATVIASQALISGAFSMARQCMQMNFLPRMTVQHTSQTAEGQIYVPQVNTALFIGVMVLVVAFQSSDALAAAYGIAVTGTFMCTCYAGRLWPSAGSSAGRGRKLSACSASSSSSIRCSSPPTC